MTYYDDKGNIRDKLLNEEAQQAAAAFVKVQRPENPIKSAQLRRFFGEYKGLQRKLDQMQGNRQENFLSIKPLVKMGKAKVAYAKARKVVPGSFVSWLQNHVDTIETVEDFDAFLLHFEACVGFCYGEGLKD
ncbi:MAG: type III-A CRISPR-associated protein Csm2 [Geoalkalibacter sp.]|jgi:CRISPR-associated protein Csm2|uniref:type III-A CRISPR-associated protein Csm2 n=1 Tax=Geoalkalibacter sp. TaxID=3041440 RepID=UPI003D09E5AD